MLIRAYIRDSCLLLWVRSCRYVECCSRFAEDSRDYRHCCGIPAAAAAAAAADDDDDDDAVLYYEKVSQDRPMPIRSGVECWIDRTEDGHRPVSLTHLSLLLLLLLMMMMMMMKMMSRMR